MAYKMSQEFPTASSDITESFCLCSGNKPITNGAGEKRGDGAGRGGEGEVSSNQTASFEEIMHIANNGSVGES